jgi:hypothetical protein
MCLQGSVGFTVIEAGYIHLHRQRRDHCTHNVVARVAKILLRDCELAQQVSPSDLARRLNKVGVSPAPQFTRYM